MLKLCGYTCYNQLLLLLLIMIGSTR